MGAASAALDALCPMRTVLERVVATPGGALVACWQLLGGAEPARLRTALRAALPEAPTTQVAGVAWKQWGASMYNWLRT